MLASIRASGQPVVPLHGAFGGASSWSFQVPALTGAGYKVHVPERRGHAHTRDVEGPLTYGVTARPHLVGWSDGAVVALLVAQRRPDLVDRLVLIGQWYNSSGKVSGGLLDELVAGGDRLMAFLRAEYDRVSPDGPEHFPVVYAKTMRR